MELPVCCDVSLLVVLVTNGSLDPLETVCGSSFDVTVEEDVWVLADVDDLPVETVDDPVKRVNLVVADSDVEDKPVVNDGGNVVRVVKTVGSTVEVD